jgi:acetyl esterase/lipase
MPQVHKCFLQRVAACLLFALVAFPAVNVYSQTLSATAPSLTDKFIQVSTIPLWEGKAPGAVGNEEDDIPFLTVFPPTMPPTGTAVIIAPGGAYIELASNHEGRQVADWFASRGVTAFLLHYRLGTKYFYPVPLQDAQRAIRLVRSRATEFGIQPDHIGMMGFSAGGHLTAMAGTLFEAGKTDAPDPVERQSSRPDFMILTYPWLNAMDPTVKGSIDYYCGVLKLTAERCKGFKEQYSPELHVTPQTPPTFIFHTAEDSVVPVETSLSFFNALRKAHVPAEMHIFEKGPHGVGLALNMAPLNVWPTALEGWLRLHGLLTPNPMPVRK